MEPRMKQTFEIGDRVLAKNGRNGILAAINGDEFTVKQTFQGKEIEVISPREWTGNLEFERDGLPRTFHCVECGCTLPSSTAICRACGGF